MAFTYTDSAKRTVRTGKAFKVTVTAAVEIGDTLALYNTDASASHQLATTALKAVAVALQAGAAGAEISAASWAVLGTKTSVGTGGIATPAYFAASTDFLGASLYQGAAGKPSSTAGIRIGTLIARDKILVDPNAFGDDVGNTITDPADAGAIPVGEGSGSVSLVSAGAETRTIADPAFTGQILNLGFKTDGGDCVVTTASPVNQTGNNTLTFADVGDNIVLIGSPDGADIEWRVLANDGVGLTTV